MSGRNIFVFLAAAAVAVLIVKKLAERSQAAEPDNSQVVHLVEETLHQHAGEDNPIVHAFEAALEKA